MFPSRPVTLSLALWAILAASAAYAEAGGYAGTLFWIDPRKDMIALYMAQVKPSDREMLRNQFWSMVEAAVAD